MFLFRDPIYLWALLPVAAVAAWAIFRPARRLAVVGSLELWQEAVDRLDRSQLLRARRITLEWLLLLAGALAAVAAAAKPALLFSAPARRVALALYPSAEIARKEGMDNLRQSADALLARLANADHVQLLLPGSLTQANSTRWMSVEDARRLVADLRPLPASAADLSLPAVETGAQHVYRIAPAGADLGLGFDRPGPAAPSETLIEVPTALPDVTFEALAAAPLPDGNVQVFFALNNHLTELWAGTGTIAAKVDGEGRLLPLALRPGRGDFIEIAPAGEALAVGLAPGHDGRERARPDGAAGSAGFLVRRETAAVKVAFVGADDPLLRRFVKVNPALAQVDKPADADILICIGAEAPAGRSALVINPPAPPTGCRAEGQLEAVVLGEQGLSVDSQDPVMRGTDFSAVAVRSVAPWRLESSATLKTLCGVKGKALIARTAPELLPPESGEPRRVYVAFATDTENTNFGTTESFVIFLANAMDWLAPPRTGPSSRKPTGRDSNAMGPSRSAGVRYEYVTPAQAAFASDWRRIAPTSPADEPSWAQGEYPAPGIYRDGRDDLHAVSLVGLRSAEPKMRWQDAVAAAPLPPAQPTGTALELWTWLTMAAIALWLAGWAARNR